MLLKVVWFTQIRMLLRRIMPDDEKMSLDERRKYLKLVSPRYKKAGKGERGRLLGEMEQVTKLHRKSLTRLMSLRSLERAPKKPRLKRMKYGAGVADAVRVVWESLDYVCAERLTPALLETAQQLSRWEELALTLEVEEKLRTISRATVQRLLNRFQQDTPKLPRRKPQPPNRLLRDVPMGRLPWETDVPGNFETDLVHHCGPVAAGEYIHTLQLVDIATGWSERVAILGRSQESMVKGFRKILERLPFLVKHLHPDNGSEFFNDHLIRFFGEKITGLSLSRSRPYQKNDNRFVEQKNSTLVRAYMGYERLDNGAQCAALNALYDRLWVYYNLFQPVLHMVSKDVVDGKLRRKHDRAQTPYQRLLASGILSPKQRAGLKAIYSQTNPRQLHRDIYQAIEHLWACPQVFDTTNRKEAASLR
jgi:hypothetical protein